MSYMSILYAEIMVEVGVNKIALSPGLTHLESWSLIGCRPVAQADHVFSGAGGLRSWQERPNPGSRRTEMN